MAPLPYPLSPPYHLTTYAKAKSHCYPPPPHPIHAHARTRARVHTCTVSGQLFLDSSPACKQHVRMLEQKINHFVHVLHSSLGSPWDPPNESLLTCSSSRAYSSNQGLFFTCATWFVCNIEKLSCFYARTKYERRFGHTPSY